MKLPLGLLKKLAKYPLLYLLRLLESDVERWKREDEPGKPAKPWRDVDGLVVLLCLFLAACPAPDLQPSPSPTPTPEPPPSVVEPLKFPLRVQGSGFVNADGSPAWVLGAVVCCGEKAENGWPLISDAALEEIAAHHGNFTHIRLGPHSLTGPDPDAAPTSPRFWERVQHILSRALELGVAVELDVIDAWGLERAHPSNFFGWGCDITKQFPTAEQFDWIEAVIAHTASYPNAQYEISNESFDCGVRPVWENAIFDALKTGAPDRLVGTNSHHPDVERLVDYVQRHGCEQLDGPIAGQPTSINEFNGCDYGALGRAAWWEDRARNAHRKGWERHLWRTDMNDAAWADALARLKRWREGGV